MKNAKSKFNESKFAKKFKKDAELNEYMDQKKDQYGVSIEEIDEEEIMNNAEKVKGQYMKAQANAIGKTKASGMNFFKKQKASMLSTE